jgi:6,7-dimethyl-8-ribityllumazine synthase
MSDAYAIAVGRFYADLAERLLAGARAGFAEAGDHAVEVFDVPGAFELPLAASYAARTGRFAGVACLGVLTCATMEQALARTGGGKRDQGRHAAEAVLAMAALRSELASRPIGDR